MFFSYKIKEYLTKKCVFKTTICEDLSTQTDKYMTSYKLEYSRTPLGEIILLKLLQVTYQSVPGKLDEMGFQEYKRIKTEDLLEKYKYDGRIIKSKFILKQPINEYQINSLK